MKGQTVREQQKNWCVHFNGVLNDRCRAGVAYRDVRDTSTTPYRLPCLADEGCADRCAQVRYPTEAEAAAIEAEITAAVDTFLAELQADVCPHCHTPIQAKRQIGRCVYARPCGCRLYQGRLSKAEQASE